MKIVELGLQTRQPEQLKQFYTQTLGFVLQTERADAFAIEAGASKLCFSFNPERLEGCYHFAFRVPYKQFEKLREWLQQRVNILPDPQSGAPVIRHEEWQAKALYFLDPEGNIVEFIAHQSITDEEVCPQENCVASICEIGLAVPCVPAFANDLKQLFRVERWKTANENFEAVGDAHGLFILAEDKRKWFPTALAAAMLPVAITVDAPAAGSISKYGYSIKQAELKLPHTLPA